MRAAQPAFGLTGMESREAGKRVGAIKGHDQPHDKLCVSRKATSANHEDNASNFFGAESQPEGKTEIILCGVPRILRVG